MSGARDRILIAARELVERGNGGAPNMSELARAVGISRQALYLHTLCGERLWSSRTLSRLVVLREPERSL